MKKIIIILFVLGATTGVMANGQFFKKQVTHKFEMQKKSVMGNNYKTLGQTSSNVPTLSKGSKWSEFNSVWLGEYAEEVVYLNNKISSIYRFDYTKSDTIGRSSFTYNSDQLITEYLYEAYTSGVGFRPQSRQLTSYSNGNLKEVTTFENYNEQTNTWEFNSRTTRELVNNGETERFISEYLMNGQFVIGVGSSITIRKLNANSSKITDYIDSTFNQITGMFELSYMESKIYDANENAIEITYYENDNGSTVVTEVDSIFYTNNIPSAAIIFEPKNGVLEKKFKYTDLQWRNYNTNADLDDNYIIAYIGSMYISNTWELFDKHYSILVDNFGSIIEMFDLYDGNAWIPNEKYTTLNNSKGYTIEFKYETFDDFDTVWIIDYGQKAYLTFDGNSNITEIINQSFDPSDLLWKNLYKYEYANYISISTGIRSEVNKLVATLYPNPSKDGHVSINVNMEAASVLTIKITDLKGSVVYTDKKELGKGLNTVELSGLQQGLYVVELSTEFGVAMTKLAVN